MGAFTSRRNHGVEEVDISSSSAYRYPPKSGCYFGSHFIMGGDRFETTQPETYLFGENQDLNFLGNRPVPFPYPAPQAHEPTKTLKSLVNIRKDSIKFVKLTDEENLTSTGKTQNPAVDTPNPAVDTHSDTQESVDPIENETCSNADSQSDTSSIPCATEDSSENQQHPRYNIEFTFDTDVKCAITIYYFVSEEISNKQAIYRPRDAAMNSETFHYKRGANQVFSQTTHIIEPDKFADEEWQYNPDKEVIPIVIQCVVEEEEYIGHCHMTFAIVEKVEGGYTLKPLKQKQMVDGLCYLLQEIYGIENKNDDRPKDDDLDDNGSECVICLAEMRDTLILPCRHLCLCNCCADNLRYQASNCPICRSPFRALLQIRAMRKKTLPLTSQTPTDSSDEAPSQEGVPAGYEAVSLIEALNGPTTPSTGPPGYRNLIDGTVRNDQTSPEGSPILSRRRLSRKQSSSSNRSRQSLRGTGSVEGGKEITEDPKKTKNIAPNDVENASIDQTLDEVKTHNTSNTSYPIKKGTEPVYDTPANLEPDYQEIAEDQDQDLPEYVSQYEDIQLNIVDETVTTPPTETSPMDGTVYTAHEAYPKDASDADIYFKPAAHTMVLCDQEETDIERCLADVGLGELSRHPGVPSDNPDASGSSYSSSDSTKGLLDAQELDKDKDLDTDGPVLA